MVWKDCTACNGTGERMYGGVCVVCLGSKGWFIPIETIKKDQEKQNAQVVKNV